MAAAALMTASCQVYRKTGTRRDGVRIVALWETVYQGKCRLRSHGNYEAVKGGLAGSTLAIYRNEIRLPVGSYAAQRGDVIQITNSLDANLIGQLWRIASDWPVDEHATAYRPPVDRLDGDELAEFEQAEVVP